MALVAAQGSELQKVQKTEIQYSGRQESLPVVHQVVRRRFSGPLLLPPLWRRDSCQERPYDARRLSAANCLPLDRLEELYSQALASHDENRRHTVFFFGGIWRP
ncbi:hypothetical protein PAMP_024235 [Pampus punctatissimus]